MFFLHNLGDKLQLQLCASLLNLFSIWGYGEIWEILQYDIGRYFRDIAKWYMGGYFRDIAILYGDIWEILQYDIGRYFKDIAK